MASDHNRVNGAAWRKSRFLTTRLSQPSPNERFESGDLNQDADDPIKRPTPRATASITSRHQRKLWK
jgi:hypothetical protein